MKIDRLSHQKAKGLVYWDCFGGTGWIHLNRPERLNALNHDMVLAIRELLKDFAADDRIYQVVVTGEGRAFCAGGDIREFYFQKQAGAFADIRQYFVDEYQMSYEIKTFPKPYVSLLHGVTMGGGMGLSINGKYRIVKPDTILAMPEAQIGFFPDVGGTSFMNECPHGLGRYYSLTGESFAGAQALYLGIATHCVGGEEFALLEASLVEDQKIDEALTAISLQEPSTELEALIPISESLLKAPSLKAYLAGEPDETLLQKMQPNAPLALHVIFQHQKACEGLDFMTIMDREFSLSQKFVPDSDFSEGVRAQLVDKDKKPQWNPSNLFDVNSEQVTAYLQPEEKGLWG